MSSICLSGYTSSMAVRTSWMRAFEVRGMINKEAIISTNSFREINIEQESSDLDRYISYSVHLLPNNILDFSIYLYLLQ
mgnify:CR=1 FL=1